MPLLDCLWSTIRLFLPNGKRKLSDRHEPDNDESISITQIVHSNLDQNNNKSHKKDENVSRVNGSPNSIRSRCKKLKSDNYEVIGVSSESVVILDPVSNEDKLKWSTFVINNDQMLTDNEIFHAQSILKDQFNNIKGFYDTQIFNARFLKNPQKYFVPYPEKFIQILHDGNLHWYTVTNLNTTQFNQVKTYLRV